MGAVEGGGEDAAVEVAGDRGAEAVEEGRGEVDQAGAGEQGVGADAVAVEDQEAVGGAAEAAAEPKSTLADEAAAKPKLVPKAAG